MSRPNKSRSIGGEENLAYRVARERVRRGLSYEALAKLMTDAGCSIQGSGIYKIEKANPPRRISVDELVAFGQVFDLEIDDLLTPVDVLEQRRAQELLKEMDQVDRGLFEAIGNHLGVYSDFLELAGSNPDLYQYVHGHRFAMDKPDGESKGTTVFSIDNLPEYDDTGFIQAITDFYVRLIDEAGHVAELLVKSGKKG